MVPHRTDHCRTRRVTSVGEPRIALSIRTAALACAMTYRMPCRPGRSRVAFASLLFAVLSMTACEREPASGAPNAAPSLSLSLPADVRAQIASATNVAAFETGLPSAPRPWEVSDSALVQHVRRANGIVHIALKAAGSARLSSTARSEPSKLFPGRLVTRGTRAGISRRGVFRWFGHRRLGHCQPVKGRAFFHRHGQRSESSGPCDIADWQLRRRTARRASRRASP